MPEPELYINNYNYLNKTRKMFEINYIQSNYSIISKFYYIFFYKIFNRINKMKKMFKIFVKFNNIVKKI